MPQLSTIIISHGQYLPQSGTATTSSATTITATPMATTNDTISNGGGDDKVPPNIRLFQYNLTGVDYDNYYLLRVYNEPHKILFFVNKTTGKIFKKEFTSKEISPGEKCPKELVLSFNNNKHMMGLESVIVHPNGYKQTFDDYGKRDSFIISLYDLLKQLSATYKKMFPDSVIEVHLSSHKMGTWTNTRPTATGAPSLSRQLALQDEPNVFTVEETQNMENMLLNDFIVVKEYPQAKYVRTLSRKKTPPATIIRKTRTFFNRFRDTDKHMKTYRSHTTSNK